MKVQEAGFQVAAVVLRKANDNTCRNEGVSPPRLSPRPGQDVWIPEGRGKSWPGLESRSQDNGLIFFAIY